MVNWIFSYKVPVDWMASTLIEIAIIKMLAGTTIAYLKNEHALIKKFSGSMSCFKQDWEIGIEDDTPLKGAVSLIYRPGKRKKYLDVSSEIFEAD
ncbi:MAG: hypothetical protein LBN96_00025 [Desulfovibrio sp.]|jgi:hypothetical protein|nr:hypothetical protein [Desulfovibrio sp.]